MAAATQARAAVEFAFVAPLLFLLLFAIVEFGRAWWAKSSLQYAVERSGSLCRGLRHRRVSERRRSRTYAANQVYDQSVDSNTFSVTHPGRCQCCASIIPLAYAPWFVGRSGRIGRRDDFDRYVMPSPFLTLPAAESFVCGGSTPPRYSSVFDWATRLTLASVFTLLVVGNVSWIIQAVSDGEYHGSYHLVLNIAARASSALFVALAAATTLTRLPPIRKAAGIEPRIAALLGTFLLTALAMLPQERIIADRSGNSRARLWCWEC